MSFIQILEGAIKEFWVFEATLLIIIEVSKFTRKDIGKIGWIVYFLSSMSLQKVSPKLLNSLIDTSNKYASDVEFGAIAG